MEFHTNAEIQSLFDSFLHSDIWNLEEHRAACEWFMGPHQSLPSDLPWALFDACQQAKDLERRGILRREEFVLEKEWLYATFSSSDISEDTKQHLPKARFIAFENAKKIFDEEIRVNAFQACENFDIRKNTIRKNSTRQDHNKDHTFNIESIHPDAVAFRLAPVYSPLMSQEELQISNSYITSLVGNSPKDKPFPCTYCSRTFNCKQAANAHVATVHKQGSNFVTCTICQADFGNDAHLTRHIREVHYNQLDKVSSTSTSTQPRATKRRLELNPVDQPLQTMMKKQSQSNDSVILAEINARFQKSLPVEVEICGKVGILIACQQDSLRVYPTCVISTPDGKQLQPTRFAQQASMGRRVVPYQAIIVSSTSETLKQFIERHQQSPNYPDPDNSSQQHCCGMCGEGGRLMNCGACSATFHSECINRPDDACQPNNLKSANRFSDCPRCMNPISFASSDFYAQKNCHRAKRQALSKKMSSRSSEQLDAQNSKCIPANYEESDSSGDECLGILLRAAAAVELANFTEVDREIVSFSQAL